MALRRVARVARAASATLLLVQVSVPCHGLDEKKGALRTRIRRWDESQENSLFTLFPMSGASRAGEGRANACTMSQDVARDYTFRGQLRRASPILLAFAIRYAPPNFGAMGPSPTLYGPES
jgi:hypothetical protein